MNCHYCGTGVSGNEIFCRFCGTRLERMQEVQLPKTEEPAPVCEDTDYIWHANHEPEPAQEPETQPDIPEIEYHRPAFVFEPDFSKLEAPEADASVPAVSKAGELEEFHVEPAPAARTVPQLRLPTGRSLVKMIFLGIVTLGIYPTVIWCRIVTELNIAASRYDGKRTMPYFAMLLLSPVTLCIYTFVWFHRFCRRIGCELQRRNIDYQFGPKDFWLWNVLGSLIIAGPFVFLHKLMKSMNKINASFNFDG